MELGPERNTSYPFIKCCAFQRKKCAWGVRGQGEWQGLNGRISPIQRSQWCLVAPLHLVFLVVRVSCCGHAMPPHATRHQGVWNSVDKYTLWARWECPCASLSGSQFDTVPCNSEGLFHHTAVLWCRVWGPLWGPFWWAVSPHLVWMSFPLGEGPLSWASLHSSDKMDKSLCHKL